MGLHVMQLQWFSCNAIAIGLHAMQLHGGLHAVQLQRGLHVVQLQWGYM